MKEPLGRRLWRRTRVGGGIALGVALLLWAASLAWGGALVFGATLGLAAWVLVEVRAMGAAGGEGRSAVAPHDARSLWVALASVGLALAWLGWGGTTVAAGTGRARPLLEMAGVALLAVALARATAQARREHRAALRLELAVVWLVVPLPLLFLVHRDLGAPGIAALLLLAKIGDIAGYYVGSVLGPRFPHHPFPRTSPNKTTVGCCASLIAGAACGGILARYGWLPTRHGGALAGLAAGALVNLAAQAGDLLESRLKRATGVKDSASTFGPSGGMLDLVDSLLVAVPVALATWPWILRWPAE